VFGWVIDHFHVNLLISEAYFVFEEGPAEGPLLQTQVYHGLQ
jgi:hypothetical protein